MTPVRRPPKASNPNARAASRRPTLADVAGLAGVSTATVSFVINGRDESITPVTRQRVVDAVETLGYRPNRAAQTLKTKRTGTIGFVTDEIAVRAPAGQTIAGAHDLARKRGSVLLIVHAGSGHEQLPAVFEDLLDRQVDGLIYAMVGTQEVSLPEIVRHKPTVLVNCFDPHDGLPAIVPDEIAGGMAAADLVLGAGHRRVAVVTGDRPSWAAARRVEGYQRALAASHIAYDERLVSYGNYRADSGYELTRQLLGERRRPTAILCGNDLMAVGAYFALKEAGLRIPEDMSVVGYDDQENLAADLSPPLSTVRLPYYDMGYWASERILAGTVSELPTRTYATCPIVSRASVVAAPDAS